MFGFSSVGAVGVVAGRYMLNKLSEFQMFVFAVAAFMFLNYILSCEVPFYIMRLYYFHKLKKAGVIDEKCFDDDNTTNTQ